MLNINQLGLHDLEGVSYLIQSNKDVQNAVGIQNPPLFNLHTRCFPPHNFNIQDQEPTKEFLDQVNLNCPVVKNFLPTVKDNPKCLFLDDSSKNIELIYYLNNILSPTMPSVMPIGMLREKDLTIELYKSNLRTIVLTDADNKSDMLRTYAKHGYYSPSRLLFVGDKTTPLNDLIKFTKPKQKISPLLRDTEQWKRLGNSILRKRMLECH